MKDHPTLTERDHQNLDAFLGHVLDESRPSLPAIRFANRPANSVRLRTVADVERSEVVGVNALDACRS